MITVDRVIGNARRLAKDAFHTAAIRYDGRRSDHHATGA